MNSFKARYLTVFLIVGFIFLGIIARLFYLMVIKHDFYLERSEKQIQKLIKIDTSRGKILDRNMYPLAISKPVYSVYASPKQIKNKVQFAKEVSPLIGVDVESIVKKIDADVNFVWLKRKIDNVNLDIKKLKSISPKKVNVLEEETRVYPNNRLLSDVIGFVGMDGGLGGLEYEFDQFLTGEQGYYLIQGDPRGIRIISSSKTLVGKVKGFSKGKSGLEASSLKGGSLVITVDYRVQFLVETYLEEMVNKVEAKGGQVIILDVKNGDIIAMANTPFLTPINFKMYHILY